MGVHTLRKRLCIGATVSAIAAVGATGAFGVNGTDKITTVAGISKFGTGGYSGDGGAATKAQLAQPKGIAVDAQGNVYIADTRNFRVRKVSQNGTIATIAGNGQGGEPSAGDGGPATSAALSHPVGIAVDGKKNVYIADFGSGRVRKVSLDGTITTFAGSACRRIPGTPNCETGDGGPATSAYLHQPHGIALDRQGNVYITDYRDHRVRKVSSDGTITTFAGTGKAGFSGDGGPATAAQLYAPTGIAFDAKGNAYITDQFNKRVRKVAPNGTITTFAGNGLNVKFKDGPATKAQLGNVFGVAVDKAGSVYIADSSPPRILKVSGGRLTRVAGRDPHGPSGGIGEGGPAFAAQMAGPNGVAVDGKGNLYVVDTAYNTVRKVWNGRRAR